MQSIEDRPFGWAYISPLRRERIEAGVKALARIDKHTTFYDWRLIGEAANDLREAAKEQSGANHHIGKAYNAAWARCVSDNPKLQPLADLDDTTRKHAIWMAQNWDAVAEWHANIKDDNIRRLINHPATVRRRYDQDHPLPPKPRKPPEKRDPAGPEDRDELKDRDETEDRDDEDESDDLDDTDNDNDEPNDDGPTTEYTDPTTVEDWMRQFEDFWRVIPPEVKIEIAKRIVQWQTENSEAVADEPTAETGIIDDALAEIGRATTKASGNKVRGLAQRKASTSTTGEPQPERLAMKVAEALANPLPEGADIFAGLGDNLGAGEVTAAQIQARRPSLKKIEATIIAARLSHPDWDDQTLAKECKRAASTIRRILDANGFQLPLAAALAQKLGAPIGRPT